MKQDQANNAISMISEDTDYSGSSVYGISQYALNYLTETSSKGLSNDNSKEKAIVKKLIIWITTLFIRLNLSLKVILHITMKSRLK